jgi:DNA-directed RNA polymerase subunit H (RpoH/RPB5)
MEMEEEEFLEMRREFRETFGKNDKDGKYKDHVVVLFRDSIGTNQVQEIYKIMDELEVKIAIVVYTDKITPSANLAIKHLKAKKYDVECFYENAMQYNVTRHVKVSKHIICSLETKNNILERYNITKEKLPFIKSDDPVLLYLGAKKGQMIEIIRDSDSNQEVTMPDGTKEKLKDVTYKIVV